MNRVVSRLSFLFAYLNSGFLSHHKAFGGHSPEVVLMTRFQEVCPDYGRFRAMWSLVTAAGWWNKNPSGSRFEHHFR